MKAYQSLLHHDKKLMLAFLFFGLALAINLYRSFQEAWYLYLAAAILRIAHLLFGNVWVAFRQMKQGKIEDAHQSLQKIQFPNLLLQPNRAYYHFIRGMIALQKKFVDVGKPHLEKAVELGLRDKNDMAMAKLNMAHIHYVQKNYNDTAQVLNEIKELQPTDLLIKEKLEELEKIMKESGKLKMDR